jgi:hypothetical protein
MLPEKVSPTEQKLLKEVFLREDRDGAPHFVYYNDEKYYLILSICEKYQIQYRTRPNCILIGFEEMARLLPDIKTTITPPVAALPTSAPVSAQTPVETMRAAHPLVQRIQTNNIDAKDDQVLLLQEKVTINQPVDEPKFKGVFPVRTASAQPASVETTVPTPPVLSEPTKSPTLSELLEQLNSQRQHTANTKQQSQDSRRQSLEAREQALLSREQAVNERERAITAREEEVTRRKTIITNRLADIEAEEQRIAHLAQSFAHRRRVLEQQRAMVNALQNHIQQMLNSGFNEMVPMSG